MELKGKTAIVTGGNGGLGRVISEYLAREGVNVAIVYAKSQLQAEEFASELSADFVKSKAFQCDLTSEKDINHLVDSVKETFGRVDFLVNDAAYNVWIPFKDIESLTLDEWEKILATNLTGPMLLTKAVSPVMKMNGGSIINISSVAGLSPTGSSIPYAVSKAGLIHLTKCMAVALAPDILVNCIAPGYLEGTRATANLDIQYQEKARVASILEKAADKEDIAKQVVSLFGADTITGQTLVVDSGRVFH